MDRLEQLGWTPALEFYLEQLQDPTLSAGRVAAVHSQRCEVEGPRGRRLASWNPPLRVVDGDSLPRPTPGDWCALAPGEDLDRLVALFPRRTALMRGGSDRRPGQQVLAANVDLVLVVTGLDGDWSPRRIERYLTLVHASGARPLVVLNKLDVCPELEQRLEQAREVARQVQVVGVSALRCQGLEPLREVLAPGLTAVLVGSSGAGKSTLLNCLLGREAQSTGPVRDWRDRGRHTTSRRELLPLPGGALVIDTPGLREVGLVQDEQALDEVFEEILELAGGCRFADCAHQGEPGCAVSAAVEAGSLSPARLQSYLALRREQHSARLRQDEHARRTQERATSGKYKAWLRESRRLKGED